MEHKTLNRRTTRRRGMVRRRRGTKRVWAG
jgi:hypothetical protein